MIFVASFGAAYVQLRQLGLAPATLQVAFFRLGAGSLGPVLLNTLPLGAGSDRLLVVW